MEVVRTRRDVLRANSLGAISSRVWEDVSKLVEADAVDAAPRAAAGSCAAHVDRFAPRRGLERDSAFSRARQLAHALAGILDWILAHRGELAAAHPAR